MLVPDSKKYITFTIAHDGMEHRLKTYWGEYRNLRDLISDKLFLEGFGDCGGMGRCATCMVEVEGLTGDAATMKRNEAETLSKAKAVDSPTRLACQIAIDDDLANVVVTVL